MHIGPPLRRPGCNLHHLSPLGRDRSHWRQPVLVVLNLVFSRLAAPNVVEFAARRHGKTAEPMAALAYLMVEGYVFVSSVVSCTHPGMCRAGASCIKTHVQYIMMHLVAANLSCSLYSSTWARTQMTGARSRDHCLPCPSHTANLELQDCLPLQESRSTVANPSALIHHCADTE